VPYEENISDARASDPLPDIGRKSAKGKSSDGNFKNEHMGDSICVKKSTRPDALKTLTAIKRAKRDGKTDATVFTPSVTPVVKAEYTFCFLNEAYIIMVEIIKGTKYVPRLDMQIILSIYR